MVITEGLHQYYWKSKSRHSKIHQNENSISQWKRCLQISISCY